MLKAAKNRWFEKIFAVYNRNLLKRRFHSLNVAGLELLGEHADLPIIVYANHSGWWDGLAAFDIFYRSGFNSFVMMEEKQLSKLFVFRLIGAFSVVRENPRQALESVKYAAEVLKSQPDSLLLIFPQGKIEPNDVRPLTFYPGISKIIKLARPCRTISMAIRYEFLGNYKPEIFIRFSEPEIFADEPTDKKSTHKFSTRQSDNLDRLKNDVITAQTQNYVNLFDSPARFD